MSDAKHPVIRPPEKPIEKPALPVIRGTTEKISDVKIVPPEQVKTRKTKPSEA